MSDLNNLLQLRNEYISCIKLARETDSKKEDALLRQEAAGILSDLRGQCSHEHTVCLRSEYEGSYSMDYDDCYPESRVCLVCGSNESAYDKKWTRLITKPFTRFEGNAPDQIKFPLDYLFTESKQMAEEKGYQYNIGGKA